MIMYKAVEEFRAVLTNGKSLVFDGVTPRAVSQRLCYAVYIRWYGRIYGERRTRGSSAPASLMYPDAALLLVRSP